jgi:hypothetical protein
MLVPNALSCLLLGKAVYALDAIGVGLEMDSKAPFLNELVH